MNKIFIKGNLLVRDTISGNVTALSNSEDAENALIIDGDVTIKGDLVLDGNSAIYVSGGVTSQS